MKLFRKLRRNLIALGKVKSYIVYAFGEIVLIVIGILIAWKIGDLNEIRKNNIVEQKVYKSLNEELNTNLRILNGLVAEYPRAIVRLENTLNYVGYTEDKITQGAKDTIINVLDKEVSLLDGSINSIINTTKFEFIESADLKDLIIMYPNKIQNFKEQDAKIKLIVANRLKPVLEKYISLVDMLPYTDPKYDSIRKYGAKSDYIGLLSDKEYQNSIIDRMLQTQIQFDHAKSLRSKTKILINTLAEELD
ncbi:hypothetical protein [Cellulophaga baltica]|uniref:Uncharacterized protein n=1 Tax=Cellulophaga baltica 18 TaxID=1348584 RepID=A0AAU8RS83_9FLAO|nr:hypothetical protein [Cellulophaga baltica]AIZ43021.1 hypothetical protein M666_16540 [Cellulophaga baltica 18]WFO16516.1 hypothetical protein M601_001485 [Cellulophaga baltica 4]